MYNIDYCKSLTDRKHFKIIEVKNINKSKLKNQVFLKRGGKWGKCDSKHNFMHDYRKRR